MAAGAAANVALGQPAPTLTAHVQASISREPGSLQPAPTLIAHLQASIFGEAQEPTQQYDDFDLRQRIPICPFTQIAGILLPLLYHSLSFSLEDLR